MKMSRPASLPFFLPSCQTAIHSCSPITFTSRLLLLVISEERMAGCDQIVSPSPFTNNVFSCVSRII